MNQDEKLEKVCVDFSKLNEDQQDYILGIMQALIFAKNSSKNEQNDKPRQQGEAPAPSSDE